MNQLPSPGPDEVQLELLAPWYTQNTSESRTFGAGVRTGCLVPPPEATEPALPRGETDRAAGPCESRSIHHLGLARDHSPFTRELLNKP